MLKKITAELKYKKSSFKNYVNLRPFKQANTKEVYHPHTSGWQKHLKVFFGAED
jgi:hypothetical protein